MYINEEQRWAGGGGGGRVGGWGWVKALRIERKITSVVHSPALPLHTYTHVNTRLVDYIPVVMFTTLFTHRMHKKIAPSLSCATCWAISMHVSVASGTALSFFSLCNTSPPPSLQLAFCGMSPLTSHSVTRVL